MDYGIICKSDEIDVNDDNTLPSSLIDSNVNIKWKQRKSKELGHVPWFVTLWG
jgi:hypothetical protein